MIDDVHLSNPNRSAESAPRASAGGGGVFWSFKVVSLGIVTRNSSPDSKTPPEEVLLIRVQVNCNTKRFLKITFRTMGFKERRESVASQFSNFKMHGSSCPCSGGWFTTY